MDDKMSSELATIYGKIKNDTSHVEREAISEKAKSYVELYRYSIELEKQKEIAYQELSGSEKQEAQNVLKKVTASNLPEFLPVSEVAMILDVSPQMVRRYCAEGKISAKQRLDDRGKWLIPTEQFLTKPEFSMYIKQKEVNRLKSIKAANTMLQMTDEDDEV